MEIGSLVSTSGKMMLPSVEVHLYQTPTAKNRECPFSVGVLNLTREEADLIASFARAVRNSPSTNAYLSERAEMATYATTAVRDGLKRAREDIERIPYDLMRGAAREKLWSEEVAPIKWPPVTDFETPVETKERNRFSGLELPDEPQAE
jgi:hypothetical protein